MVYERLEWKIGKTWDGGRDREGPEVFEYCDNLFFDANDRGRCRLVRLAGGDVTKGGNGG
jgi:hypothetical protein